MKLTANMLKRLIAEELAALAKGDVEDVTAKEVDPGDEADTLVEPIDHYKALKVEEARLQRRLSQIKEQRSIVARKINRTRK